MRPDDIGKVFGQDHILEVLINWMDHPEQVPASLLLSGPYGTGKTTIARILAKHLALGSTTDITEINAANARGIDDARSWAEAARFSPLGQGSKVFIIDELHQMTQQAQSAMLKVIEEPPPKIHFFLCTTEPSKLLPQIRSRCTHLELKLLTEVDTIDMLSFVFEGQLTEELMAVIHKKSGGHARDAVKIAQTAVHSKCVTVEDLNRNVGLGFRDIVNIVQNIIGGSSVQDAYGWVSHITDEQALTDIINEEVDLAVGRGAPKVLAHYKELLEIRVMRSEWKISAHQQALFLITKMCGVN